MGCHHFTTSFTLVAPEKVSDDTLPAESVFSELRQSMAKDQTATFDL
jgi:hypothetical protein